MQDFTYTLEKVLNTFFVFISSECRTQTSITVVSGVELDVRERLGRVRENGRASRMDNHYGEGGSKNKTPPPSYFM